MVKAISVNKLTARELIKMLLDHNLDNEIIIKSMKGNRCKNVTICLKESEGIGCLFG